MATAAYAATTALESTFGDAFTAELSSLRVSESLPSDPGVPSGIITHYEPAKRLVTPHMRRSRQPANIVPIGNTTATGTFQDVFYLGLDIEFSGTELGLPGKPDTVNVEVQFFLEGYGTGDRQEINIQPQIFTGLNTNPIPTATNPDRELRHSLWVQVAAADFPAIIQDPTGVAWNVLFKANTIYRVAASVRIVDATLIPSTAPYATGFLEGLVMQTEEWNQFIVPNPPGP